MKLLIFCPYYPPHIGGLESHADEFNKHLSERGIAITVFTPRLPQTAPEFETKYNGVKIIRFPAFEIIPNYPLPKFWSLKFWQLFCGLFQKKFDFTISRTRFFVTSLLALVYAKINKVKWIHIEHGSDFVRLSSTTKSLIAKIYDYTFGYLVFKFSNQNISISRAVQKFVKKFDRRESLVIYRGLDFDAIDRIQTDEEIEKKYPDKIIISFVGRLYKWKGVENSILAIQSLPKELKEKIVFLLIGDGEDYAYLKSISEKENAIIMLGNLSREKVIGLLKASGIYIHSAYPGGGLSTSLLEAMYCGCAVIATPNEGADEVIENDLNGILIEKPDAKLIAKEIANLIENKEKIQRLSNKAELHITNNFNWKKSIDAYAEIFGK